MMGLESDLKQIHELSNRIKELTKKQAAICLKGYEKFGQETFDKFYSDYENFRNNLKPEEKQAEKEKEK